MPSLTLPEVPQYTPAAPTQENLNYADLATIDLSKAVTPEGRAELALQVRDAMTTQGFFYVVNHGYTQSQTDRMFDIANLTFEGVSPEEKQQYTGKEIESYQGYKPRQQWQIEPGVLDQIEHYNINRDVTKRMHPHALRPFIPEIQAFAHHNHYNVLFPILSYPRTEDEETKTKNVWLKGHTDIGGVTILWSQPVAALQILSPNGKQWQWIKHVPNALVVNIGDALDFMSGGYYKATIHRVVQPPVDQRNHTRLGMFYFCMLDDDVQLAPLAQSPVLQKVGIERQIEDEHAPTMKQWREGRTSAYGRSQLTKTEQGTEVELINGVVVKHYN
ncbi:hypothetical protein PLICRDRAFT_173417 [Plicaturopsis crispa FD-325 SS-3]|nr:hypothetical protein PLICRDRAFT_173417 [Plicaturopsis crispa FD-325 SS-3]